MHSILCLGIPFWEFLLCQILSKGHHQSHSQHSHLHYADVMAKQKSSSSIICIKIDVKNNIEILFKYTKY